MSRRGSRGAVELQPVGALTDGTAYYAPIGELVYDGDYRVLCHLCGRSDAVHSRGCDGATARS